MTTSSTALKRLAFRMLVGQAKPADRLRELRNLLRPGGRIALAIQPRSPDVATAQAAEELQNLLTQAGLTQIHRETLELNPPVACVLATSVARLQ